MSLLLTRSGYTSGLLSRVIDNGYDVLGFNPEYSDIYGAWLVRKRPLLDGTVYDETPSRKDRQELSARATSFATNQYFNGPVDIAGWTEFSISCWIRHGEVAADMYAMGSYASAGANRAFTFGVLKADDKPILYLFDNAGGSGGGVITFPANTTNDNSWHLLTATYDFATETMTGYIDGRDVTAASSVTAGTNGSINTSQNPSDFTIGTLLQVPTSFDWNGQLQLPMLYEGIWTPSEVRDLYLQNYENVTSPTYAWFLDGGTAHSIAGSSSVAAVNGPTRYEDQQSPDWLNMQGWNFGNKLRLTKTPESGDSFTLRIKTTDTNFIFLNGSANNTIYYDGVAATSGPNAFSGGTTAILDGVDISSYTRLQLSDAISDNVEHELVITKTAFTNWGKVEVANYNFGNGSLGGLANGYVRLTHINGVAITADDIDFDNTTVLAPKVFSANQDTGGYAGNDNSFGDCKRNWQLNDGPAINLDGVNQYGSAGDDDIFSFGDGVTDSPFSISAKIDLTLDNTIRTIISKSNSNSDVEWRLMIRDAFLYFYLYDKTENHRIGAYFSSPLPTQQLLATYDGSGLAAGVKIYSDGVEQTLTEVTTGSYVAMENTSSPVKIGTQNFGNYLSGQIWDVRIYDSEVTPSTMDSVDPIAHWPISEQTGTTSYDISGNQKNIEWQNSPDWGTQDNYFWSENQGCSAIWDVTSVTDAAAGPEIVGAPIEAGVSISLEIKTTDTIGVLFGNAPLSSPYLLIWNIGQFTTTLSAGAGSPTILIDGVEFVNGVNTRSELASAIATGDWVAIELSEVDLSSFSNGLFLSGYPNATLRWNGQVRNLVINGEPFDGPLLIPALAAGTNDANGNTLTNPAGPYHNDSQALLEEFPVTNSDSQGDVFYAAGFDGVSSKITGLGLGSLTGDWEIQFRVKAATTGQEAIFGHPSNVFKINVDGNTVRCRPEAATDVTFTFTHITDFTTPHDVVVKRESGVLTASVDGVLSPVTFATTGPSIPTQIGLNSVSTWGEFSLSNVKVIDEGVTVLDMPLYKDSLDRSDNNNHGTDTNVSYLFESRELDLNPTIAQTNTRAVTTGDRSIVRIGPKAAFAGNDVALLVQGDAVVPAIFDKDVAITPIDFGAETTGGGPAYTYTISAGALPTGLTIDASTGIISGTPTVAELGSFTVRATDFYGSTASSSSFDWQSSSVPLAISSASTAMSINDAQETGGVWLSDVTPTLAGVVQDETLERKDRTRLSCRASDFDGINQSFSGGNTSTSKTQLSAAVWCRPTDLTGIQTLFGEYNGTGSQIGWLVYFSSLKVKLEVSEDGGVVNRTTAISQGDVAVENEWIHIAITLSMVSGANEVRMYVDGKEVSTNTSGDTDISGIHDSTEPLTIGDYGGGSDYFTGQLQQPIIYQGVWSAAQVRDLYLQQTDNIPITYGWFLDSDTAHPLTSASPYLTPANSPDLYEDDAVPVDWLNQEGWNGAAEFNGSSSTIDFGNLSDVLQSITFDFYTDAEITSASSFNAAFQFNTGSASLIVFGAWTGLLTDEIIATGDTSSERTAVVAGDLASISAGWHTLKLEWNATAGYYEFTLDDVTYPSTAGTSGHVSSRISLNEFSAGRSSFSGRLRNLIVEGDAGVLLNSRLASDSVDISGNGNDGTDTDVTYVPIPKRWDEELDSAGNAANDSNSFGTARRDGQLRGSKNAINLDGINQYGSVADDDPFRIYGDMTASCWVSLDTTSNNRPIISFGTSGESEDTNALYNIYYDGVLTYTHEYGAGQNEDFPTTTTLSTNTPTHIAFVRDDTAKTVKLYVNGSYSETFSYTNSPTGGTSSVFTVGRFNGTSNYLDGKLWGVHVYDSAKTDAQIDAIYSDGLDVENAVGIWPMAETTGSISYDVSGNGKDCTWQNSPERVDQDSYHWNQNQGCSSRLLFSDFGVVLDDDIPEIAIDKAFSITFGIETGSDVTARGQVFACYDSVSTSFFNICITGGELVFGFYDSVYLHRLSVSISPNTLYSAVYSYDGAGNPTLTVNGGAGTSSIKTYSANILKPIFGQRRSDNASQFFEGIINSFKIYSDATFSTQIYGVDGGESWEDTIGSNNGTVVGTSTIVKIPALAAGINDTNGYPLNQPAGPWLYEGDETYVDFDVVANANQWLEQRWIGAEFDGVSSSTLLSGNFDWSQSFDISLNYRLADHSLDEYLFCNSNTLAYSLRTNNGQPRLRIGGTTFTHSQVGSLTDFNDLRVTYTGGQTGDIEITLNGVTETFTNDTASPPPSNQIRFGSDGAVTAFTEGEIRTLAVTNGASDYYDSPLLGCSLDLSSQVNHGTDTDVVYNRLTDVSYQAGDTVEQPFSVSTTGNKVYDLVKFTFPVTT